MKRIILLFSFLLYCQSICFAQDIDRIIKSKPFEMTGAIGGNVGYYGVRGIDARTSPFRYGITARLNIKIYSFDIPIYATLRDHSFNYGGSFSRFRINPSYKWVKLHIGDVFMNFNRYTLSGRTVRGVGVELTPGKFRFKALYGKIEDLRSFSDTLLLGTNFNPTYSRRLAALGIGFGTASTHFDVFAVRTWDNLDSLNGEQINEKITRQSNTVAGSVLKLRLGRSISFQTNFGLSFLTTNLDSYGENFVIGQNGITNNLVEGNLSSTFSYAGDVGLTYSAKFFSINGNVQYIQPYYQPLSVAFINSDILNYTVGGSLSLFERKLNLTGSVGVQSNNLTQTKLSTSNHIIANIAANIRISKQWSVNINYFNFAQDFTAQLVQIEDIYSFAISNNIATASLKNNFRKGNLAYSTSISGGRNNFYTVDNNELEQGSYLSYNGSLDFSIFNSESNFRVSSGISYRTYERENSTTSNYGVRMMVRKGWFDNKLSGNLNSNFSFNDNQGKREGFTIRNSVGADYKINKASSVGIILSQISRNSTIRNNFSEIRTDLRYIYQFQPLRK